MAIALLWSLIAGIIIAMLGLWYAFINRKGVDSVAFNAWGALFLFLFCIPTVHWKQWVAVGCHVSNLPALILSMGVSGTFMVAGVILMIEALKRGRIEIVWTITQTSMVIPFFLGMLVTGTAFSSRNIFGLIAIIAGITIFGFMKQNHNGQKTTSRWWFILALSSFLLIGLSQFSFSIPAFWDQWKEESSLRIPLQAVAGFALMLVWKPSYFLKKDFLLWWSSAVFAILTFAGRFAIYGAIDHFASLGLAHITYPVCQSVAIVGIILFQVIKTKKIEVKTVMVALLMIAGLFALT